MSDYFAELLCNDIKFCRRLLSVRYVYLSLFCPIPIWTLRVVASHPELVGCGPPLFYAPLFRPWTLTFGCHTQESVCMAWSNRSSCMCFNHLTVISCFCRLRSVQFTQSVAITLPLFGWIMISACSQICERCVHNFYSPIVPQNLPVNLTL